MKIQITSTKIVNWLCILMILVMIVMLFTPYWTYVTKEKNPDTGKREEVTKVISISDYVWFPRDHKDMTAQFEDLYPEMPKGLSKEEKEAWPKYWINDLVLMPALVLVAGIAVGIVTLFYSHLPLSSLLALILGGLGTYSYLARPEFKLGDPTIHIVVSAVTAALGLAGVVWFFVRKALKK